MSARSEFFKITEDGVLLFVQVSAGAKRSEFAGISEDGFLRIKISAPAERGKANKELINFLSKALGIRKSELEIISGEFSRKKQIIIKTNCPEKLIDKILQTASKLA